MPVYACRSAAVAQRVRSVPKAAASRGAQTGPAPGKLAKSAWSGVVGEDGRDLRIEAVNGLEQGAELGGVALDHERERVDDRRVGGQRLGGGDGREPRRDHRRAAAVVLLIEPADGGGPRALHGGERRPLCEEVAGLPRVEGPDPVERVGEVLLEQAREPVGQAAAEIDQLAAVLAEQLEPARRDRIRPPGAELRAVGAHQVEQQRRVGRVILSAAGMEDLAIARQRLGIDRVEHEELVLHQRVHHRAFALFDGNPHGPAPQPLPELGHPGVQRVGPLLEIDLLHRAARRRLELHRVPLIPPIQTDVRRHVLVLHGPAFPGTRAWRRSGASPIVES